jgi:hypothetical protein
VPEVANYNRELTADDLGLDLDRRFAPVDRILDRVRAGLVAGNCDLVDLQGRRTEVLEPLREGGAKPG